MAASLDGKITTITHDLIGFGGAEDRAYMDRLRARADLVLIGAGTLRAEDPPLLVREPDLIAQRRNEQREPQPINAVVSRTLDFVIESSAFFNCPETRKWVFTSATAPAERVRALQRYAELIFLPENAGEELDLSALVQSASAQGVKQLLLEGGGNLNFAMLQQDLIDEINITLCPLVFGGDRAPSLFGGAGFAGNAVEHLRLQSAVKGGEGQLFLRYLVDRDHASRYQ